MNSSGSDSNADSGVEPAQQRTSGCSNCRDQEALGFEFSFAFQPIVDVNKRTVLSHEALVRGLNGEGAISILSRVTDENRYQFDQQCCKQNYGREPYQCRGSAYNIKQPLPAWHWACLQNATEEQIDSHLLAP